MFDKIKEKLTKRAFGNQVVLTSAKMIASFLNDESSKKEYPSSRYFNKHGESSKKEFRKHMMDIIVSIVEDKSPVYAMRRQLISSGKSSIINRMFFDDEFADNRESLYSELNKHCPEKSYSDEICAQVYMWSEAECCILRVLQAMHFEKITTEDDFWKNYMNLYGDQTRSFYKLILESKEGIPPSYTVENVLFKHASPLLEQMEKKWTGESEE
jgi:hypothetical protein